jgi:hypothetical protein
MELNSLPTLGLILVQVQGAELGLEFFYYGILLALLNQSAASHTTPTQKEKGKCTHRDKGLEWRSGQP